MKNDGEIHFKQNFKKNKEILKNMFIHKSNCQNTVQQFYSTDAEIVRKLDLDSSFVISSPIKKNNSKPISNLKLSNNSNRKLTTIDVSIQDNNKNKKKFPRIINFNSESNNLTELNESVILINENNSYSKRFDNAFIENQMEISLKNTKEELNKIKGNKDLIIAEILKLQNEIIEIKVQLEVLKNFEKYTELSNNSYSKKVETLLNKKSSFSDADRLFNARESAIRDTENRKLIIKNLDIDLFNKIEARNKLNLTVENFNNQIIKLKETHRKIRNKLLRHYHNLLSEGKDTRNEGLVWIIKAIWNLNSNVEISHLPIFLDELSITYLFSTAHKEIELQKLKNSIDENKQNVKLAMVNKFSNEKIENRMSIPIFKTTLEKKIVTQGDINEKGYDFDKKPDVENFYKIIKNTYEFDVETITLLKSVSNMEKTYQNKKDEIKKMKRAQLNRLEKEFLGNNYSRRYDVSLETIISAIAGEDYLTSELVSLSRERKNYFEKLKNCQFYKRDYISIT